MSAIVAWLDRLGLSRYTAVFVDNDVVLDVLPISVAIILAAVILALGIAIGFAIMPVPAAR